MKPVRENPPHPGEYIQEALEELGMSARQFAAHLGVAPATVTRLLNQKGPMTAEMAARVHAALGGPTIETWLRMQASYDAWHISSRVDVSHISKLEYPHHSINIK